MASRISVMLTGEFLRLKRLSLTGIFAVADLLERLILLTTLSAAVAKKVLNDSAISDGSLMLVSLIVSEVQFSLLFLYQVHIYLYLLLDLICFLVVGVHLL